MGLCKAETNIIKENYRKKSEKVKVEKLKKVSDSPERGGVSKRGNSYPELYRAMEETGQRL